MSSKNRSPNAELGLLAATMIGMGAMIGAGIFVLTGLAAEIAGPAATIVFALNGIVTAFTALTYAELAASIPKSGGGYAFVREIFDDFPSFIMGWMLWFPYMIAGALYALGFAPNFLELLHVYGVVVPPQHVDALALPVIDTTLPPAFLLAFTAVLGLVALNAVSTAASGSVETVFTIIKVGILVVFVGFGLASPMFSSAEFHPLFPQGGGPAALLPAMGLTFIAFEGYDLITTVTEEVKNPRENIPKAIFVSLIATVIVYLAVVTVAVGTLGAQGLAAAGEAGIAAAATSLVAAGIPVPDSIQVFAQSTFRAGLEAFDGPAVHKPAIGTNGQRLSLVSEGESVPPVIGNRRTLLQEFITTDGNTPWDIRVYVVEGHILGAMRRHAPAGDWRTNVALGGDAEDGSDTLDQTAKQLARRTTEVLGLDYAGIDMIRRNGDWYVLEANPTAGFKGFFGATGTSPAPHIARLAVETVGGQIDDAHVEELAHTLDDSVPACKPAAEDTSTESQTVGFTEEITVNGTRDMTTVVAKADTGVKRTSIDTEIASTIDAGPIIDTVQVRSGTQRTRQVRPVVEIQLRLAGWWHTVPVSIEDRSHMEYPVLLGRDVLTGHQVDLERRVDEE